MVNSLKEERKDNSYTVVSSLVLLQKKHLSTERCFFLLSNSHKSITIKQKHRGGREKKKAKAEL